MIRTFVGLKARLLRNTLRGSGGVGLVIFTFVVVVAGSTAAVLVWRASGQDRAHAAPAMGGLMVLGWALAPLLFGSSDETIDTTRLAMFPLPARPMAIGLAAAGLVGPGPLAALLPLGAIALRAPTPLSLLVAAAAAGTTILLATTSSRWLLTALGARLRRRRSRDLATLLAGLGAGVFGLGLQVVSRYGIGIGGSEIAQLGPILAVTPLGWSGDALGRASNGEVFIPLAELGASWMMLALVLQRWLTTLEVALTDVEDGGSTNQLTGHLLTESSPLFQRVKDLGRTAPRRQNGASSAMAAVTAKERRYLFRHPRYRVQIVSQGTVLLVGGAPFLSAVVARNPEAVLMGCIPGLTAGVTGSNLLGSDGRALWGEAVALPTLRTVLRGRSLAFVAIGLGAAAILTFGVAVWTGGWRFVPVTLGAAVGMAFAGAGVGSFTSTVAPTPLPDDNSPNPFATTSPGGGCLNGIATIAGVLLGLVAAGPILVGLALTPANPTAGVATLVLAPLYGFGLWLAISHAAARRADRRLPEILLALSSS